MKILALLTYFCLIHSSSCISWPGGKIAKVASEDLRSKTKTMFIPSAAIDLQVFSGQPDEQHQISSDNLKREIEVFGNLIDKTHMVRRVEDKSEADFIIELQLRQDSSQQNPYWLLASAATMTVVPYWGQSTLTGKLSLKDRGGKELRSFEASDDFTFIVNLLAFPLVPFYFSQNIEKEIRENLYRHLIVQLVKEGIQVGGE